jgi:hypothetical protein
MEMKTALITLEFDIVPLNRLSIGYGRTGTINDIDPKTITAILGFKPKKYSRDDGDGKVTMQWCFMIGGRQFAIWDYRGSRWSCYGNAQELSALFGADYFQER